MYKRQSMYIPRLVKQKMKLQEKVGFLRKGPIEMDGLEAVSYTHLDVYKRQGEER